MSWGLAGLSALEGQMGGCRWCDFVRGLFGMEVGLFKRHMGYRIPGLAETTMQV